MKRKPFLMVEIEIFRPQFYV